MTTQPGSASPFQDSTEGQASNTPEKFSFRTMQDDLLAAPKNGLFDANKPPASSLVKEQPSGSAQIKSPVQSVPQKEALATNPNPFLDQATLSSAPIKETSFPKTTPSREAGIIEVSLPQTNSLQPGASVYKIIIIVIILLIVGIIGLGGYYFWMTRTPKQTPATAQPVIETITPVEEPIVITPPVEKYSLTKPNYLTIDLANLSSAEIQAAVSTVANDLKDLPSQSLYEFIVVDANNNPVAFPIFATAAKLNFSPTILSSLGESFSLFLYNDNDAERLGLSVSVSRADVLTTELRQQEKTLPVDLSFLFLDSKPEITTGQFKDGSFNDSKTRYLNINSMSTLSIDYAIIDNKFTIATSKNSLQSILDYTQNTY